MTIVFDDRQLSLKITTEGFASIGASIASAGLPVLHVQEGRHLQPELGATLTIYPNGAEGRANSRSYDR